MHWPFASGCSALIQSTETDYAIAWVRGLARGFRPSICLSIDTPARGGEQDGRDPAGAL